MTAKKTTSKTSKTAKATPMYLESAELVALNQHLNVLRQFNSKLMQVLSQHLTSLGPDLQKLDQEYWNAISSVEAQRARMIFEGHGVRGLGLAAAIRTAEDDEAYRAKVLRPITENPNVDKLNDLLMDLVFVNGQQGVRNWVPRNLFENPNNPLIALVKESPTEDIAVRDMEDGIYLSEKSYELVLKVDDTTTLMYGPLNNMRLISYCPMEDADISHVSAQYLDIEKAEAAVRVALEKTNLRDLTVAEFQQIYNLLKLLPEEQYGALKVVNKNGDFEITFAEAFTMSMSARGVGSIVGLVEGVAWEGLTLLTRRLLVAELVAMLKQVTGQA